MTATNWNVVLGDSDTAVSNLSDFVRGDIGMRPLISLFGDEARTELYRLEKSGVTTARKRVRDALRRRGVKLT